MHDVDDQGSLPLKWSRRGMWRSFQMEISHQGACIHLCIARCIHDIQLWCRSRICYAHVTMWAAWSLEFAPDFAHYSQERIDELTTRAFLWNAHGRYNGCSTGTRENDQGCATSRIEPKEGLYRTARQAALPRNLVKQWRFWNLP